MVAPELIEELKAFGLSTYEAQAYTSLLLGSPGDASSVAQRTGIPSGRVYDVLNSLVERELLQLQNTRPKQYRALPPRIALANLLTQRKRDFDARYEELTRLASDVEKRLAPRAKGQASSFYHVSVGDDETRGFLAEKVKEAHHEILVNLEFKRYDEKDVILFEAFQDAHERGVRVRVLVRDGDIPHILESPYNELIARTMLPHLGRGLEVRVIEGEPVPFGVIDGEKALIAVKNPLDPRDYFALVFVWDPKFASDLTRRYDALWRDAEFDATALAAGLPDEGGE